MIETDTSICLFDKVSYDKIATNEDLELQEHYLIKNTLEFLNFKRNICTKISITLRKKIVFEIPKMCFAQNGEHILTQCLKNILNKDDDCGICFNYICTEIQGHA